jgi:hypothetical protein
LARQSSKLFLEDNQMNIGRFAGAVIGVWVVRVALNATFYTQIAGRQFEQMSSAHPGMFRTVIPAYIVTDLIFALGFTFLFVKVGAALGGPALGGGIKAGVTLGVTVALLSPVIGNLYHYYSVTYLPAGLALTDSIFQVIAHAIEGGVAGLIYGRYVTRVLG